MHAVFKALCNMNCPGIIRERKTQKPCLDYLENPDHNVQCIFKNSLEECKVPEQMSDPKAKWKEKLEVHFHLDEKLVTWSCGNSYSSPFIYRNIQSSLFQGKIFVN